MSDKPVPPEISEYYARFGEAVRLSEGPGALEKARTQEILKRHLPPAPARVLDVGGGPGVYSAWLLSLGYEVHLVDPVPRHIEQARERAKAETGRTPASLTLGDARALVERDGSADVVLLMGPLYHLVEQADRLKALAEARRVLKPGGLLAAAAISRFASLLEGLRSQIFEDPAFARIVERDLANGRHVNDTDRLEYFTTAYFHEPDELADEIVGAGFSLVELLAVEGSAAWLPDLAARWKDDAQRETLLGFLRCVEREPSLLGASPHLLAIAHR